MKHDKRRFFFLPDRRVFDLFERRAHTLPSVAEESTTGNMPALFARAISSLTEAAHRPDVRIEPIKAPQRLAPWSHAVGAEVVHNGAEVATGRLVLLYDPDGYEVWEGTLRLVSYAMAELDQEMAQDPLLPEVAWSWLLDALNAHSAEYAAAAGTVTQTLSTRFGELAGPRSTIDIELRASWTSLSDDLGGHMRAWVDLLCAAAGVPPYGVSVLPYSGAGSSY